MTTTSVERKGAPAKKQQHPALAAVMKVVRTNGIYLAFAAIIILFAFLTDGILIGPQNLTNIVLQYSYILVLAIGMVIVIIGGHIDLSVGSVAAFAGAVSAVIVIQNQMPWWLGVLAGIGVGRIGLRVGDGFRGWPEPERRFDGILLACAPDHLPETLAASLKPGGRLVLPIGPAGGTQQLTVVTRGADGEASRRELLPVRFVPTV